MQWTPKAMPFCNSLRHHWPLAQLIILLYIKRGEKMEKKLCEVNINFRIPKNKIQYIYNAQDELAKAGITFDTGGCADGDFTRYDWNFDWSLKGGIEVTFKKYKNA